MLKAPEEEYMETEFLIIGSGISGLRSAIELSKKGKKTVIITKSRIIDSNTYLAQGGIAAIDPERVKTGADNYDSRIKDTISAGDGLCKPVVVKRFVENAFDTIKFLRDNDVEFSESEITGNKRYKYLLHQEGGHSKERIYCVGDYTGKVVEENLAATVLKDKNISVFENHTAINLITKDQLYKQEGMDKKKNIINRKEKPNHKDGCLGAYVLDRKRGKVRTISAKKTILATGGAGRVFKFTTNPKNATGDGIAMAYRAGAKISNMEFLQFHPTVLYEADSGNSGARRFLLTEALRGRSIGGILTLSKDSTEDFVLGYDSQGSHGTRDIVARAIDTEMKKNGLKNVFLNVTEKVTGKDADFMQKNFPMIYDKCMEKGIDMTKDAIPVIPAAHYTCGGVVVDEYGCTDIDGLYAIGEVSCTGLMGANRLASNSLPEAAMYGKLAIEHAISAIGSSDSKKEEKEKNIKIPIWTTGSADKKIDSATTNQLWDTARTTMMNLCGIDRNKQRLKAALYVMYGLCRAADEIYWDFYPAHEVIELRNLTLVSKLTIESALGRKESRGGHIRSDYPAEDDKNFKKPTIIKRIEE